MAAGGKRPGAGRKKGPSAPTRQRIAVAERALVSGLTPLDYMLGILRDEANDKAERFAAAKECAPYIHPRLASVEASVKITEHEDNVRQLHAAAASLALLENEQRH